jgi:hypothetical protein
MRDESWSSSDAIVDISTSSLPSSRTIVGVSGGEAALVALVALVVDVTLRPENPALSKCRMAHETSCGSM